MKARLLSLLLSAALLTTGAAPCLAEQGADASGAGPSAETVTQAGKTTPSDGTRYVDYLESILTQPAGGDAASVQGESGRVVSGAAAAAQGDFDGGAALRTEEGSVVEWTLSVPVSGVYTLTLTVGTEAAKKSAAQRSLFLDGRQPFEELKELTFRRRWEDQVGEDGFDRDRQGNQLRPEAQAAVVTQAQALAGDSGEAYRFYLESGEHTLRLEATKELLVIDRIDLLPYEAPRSYAQVAAQYKKEGIGYASQPLKTLEAELCSAKSDYSIYPVFDRTSAVTSPQSTTALMLNTIGGTNWQLVGQWIEWTVEVEETGLYQLSFRYKQSSLRGVFVTRELSIDGEVPFAEAAALKFPYSNKWQVMTAGDDEGNPYAFYLEAGKTHTLRLRVVLGDLYAISQKVEQALFALNADYRSILSITGTTPDIYRDYDFPNTIPEVLESMKTQSAALKEAAAALYELTGEKGEMFSMLETMYFQLDKMLKKPYEIARQFTTFKSNLSSLGDWVYQITNQPLQLDTLMLGAQNVALPRAQAGFFQSLAFNFELFVQSFITDYNVAADGTAADPLVVWVPTGRDQWSIISSLADNSFTPSAGVPVTVRLVAPTALLPSALSGRGPDVALSNAQAVPVDYALRSAVMDLSGREGLDEVLARFTDSALQPLRYGGGLYGLPESQTWPMMFCRTDVLEELGVQSPKTWTDVLSVVPVIKRRNMEFGMIVGYSGFLQLLYQHGGTLYREDGVRTALDSNEAIAAFEQLCNLFTQYKLPIEYNAANRFRSGEMPIVIADYAFYNQLTVFAPEISGLWEMAPVPGVQGADGTIDNTVVTTTTAAIIMKDTNKPDDAWAFLKWWTSAETQAAFGVEMEAVLGPSAKQPTANIEALSELPWTVAEYQSLLAQQKASAGIPTVPGYYQAERLVGFAFNDVYNDNSDPVEELEDIILSINTELQRKHEEFEKQHRQKGR